MLSFIKKGRRHKRGAGYGNKQRKKRKKEENNNNASYILITAECLFQLQFSLHSYSYFSACFFSFALYGTWVQSKGRIEEEKWSESMKI